MHTCSLIFCIEMLFSKLQSSVVLLAIQTEEAKVKRSIRDAAKKGHTDVLKILAKEIVQSRKAVSKLYASKAQMNSVVMQMQNQLCKCTSIMFTLYL